MIVSTVYATRNYESEYLPRSVEVQTMDGKKKSISLTMSPKKHKQELLVHKTHIDLIDSLIIHFKVDAEVLLFRHCVIDQKRLWELKVTVK